MNWNLPKIKNLSQLSTGQVNNSWLVTTIKEKFLLQQRKFIKNTKDLIYENIYLEQLQKNDFRYQLPTFIQTKQKNMFISHHKDTFILKTFVDGNHEYIFNIDMIKQLSTMIGVYHQILRTSVDKNEFKIKQQTNQVFSMIDTLHTITNELSSFQTKFSEYRINHPIQLIYQENLSYYLDTIQQIKPILKLQLPNYPIHRDINPLNVIWKNKELIGLIDFENVSSTNDPLIKDLSVIIQHFCKKTTNLEQSDISLINTFLIQYQKFHKLTKKEKTMLPALIISGLLEDITYYFWLFFYEKKDYYDDLINYHRQLTWHQESLHWLTEEISQL
ncbi:MAG: phosphotransferase [Candidatus Hodarchaeales archaeon]|jgi:thiamine kinase-like enzyme